MLHSCYVVNRFQQAPDCFHCMTRNSSNLIKRHILSGLFVFTGKTIHSISGDDVFAFTSGLNNLVTNQDTVIHTFS